MSVALYRKGPCTVKFGGAVIGQTEGDVVFKYSPQWKTFTPDQSTGPQAAFIVSESVEVKIPLVPRADAWEIMRANGMPAGLKKVNPAEDSGATTVSGAHVAGATTLAVVSGAAVTDEQIIRIGSGATTEFRRISNIATNNLTVTALTYAHANGEAVQEVFGSYLTGDEAVGQTSLSINDDAQFTAGDLISIGEGTLTELRVVASVSAGIVVVTESIAFAHLSGTLVMRLDATPELKMTLGNNRDNVQFGQLTIDPLDGSDDIVVYKAICTGEIELALKKEEETVMEMTFVGIEDTSRSNGDRLASIGLQSVS